MASSLTSDDSFSGRELAKITREVEKDLGSVKKALETLRKQHIKMKAPNINASMGFVSSDIYETHVRGQYNLLQALPVEIQRMVWSYLVYQPDRTALALTCKLNAQMHEELKVVYGKIAIKSVQKEHRMAVLVRLSSWMPGGYRLCFECVRYCQYPGQGEWGGDSAMVDERFVRAGRVKKNTVIRGPRCPPCKHRNAVDQIKHKGFVQEYKRALIKHVGPLGT